MTITQTIIRRGLPVFGYLSVCLTCFIFAYLAVNAPSTYVDLRKEDSWIENFTAIWLFLAGILLIVAAFLERRVLPTCLYILGGIVLLFGAGEEISWGQRIFGFHTPDYIIDLNAVGQGGRILHRQPEFNIHNLYALRPFIKLDYYSALFLCIMTYACFFYKKDMILGIPLPSIPLVFAFMVMLSHVSFIKDGNVATAALFTFASSEKVLLLLFIIYMLFDRQIPLIIAATATMFSVLVFSYIYFPNDDMVYAGEMREYLFGFCCFLYSLELLLLRDRQTENYQFGFDWGGRFRVPFLLAMSFVITGSIWLATLKYIKT